MNLTEARKKIPSLQGLTDENAMDVLHRNYYPDWSRQELDSALGYKAPEAETPARGLGGTLKDIGVTALKSAISIPEMAVGMADLVSGGQAGKFLENEGGPIGFRPEQARQFLETQYTPAQQKANAAVQKADGFMGTMAAALENPSVIGHSILESAPLMLAGGEVGAGMRALTMSGAERAAIKALPKAEQAAAFNAASRLSAQSAGAIGEGVTAAGSAAEQYRQQTKDGLLTPEQSGLAALSGAATYAFGRIGSEVAQKLGFADIHTMLAGGAAAPGVKDHIVKSVLKGMVSEGVLEELPQGISEQVLQNIALGKPIDEGVAHNAVLSMLTGAAMGGGANVVQGFSGAPAPVVTPPPAAPPAGPLTRAAQAGGIDPHAPGAPMSQEQADAEAQRLDAEAAAQQAAIQNAPIPMAPEAEQTLLAHANQRREALDLKANGTKDQKVTGEDGKPVVIPGQLKEFLTPDEKAEREFLDEHGGDAQQLAKVYGIPKAEKAPADQKDIPEVPPVEQPQSGPFRDRAESDAFISQQKQAGGARIAAVTHQFPDGTFGPVTKDSPYFAEAKAKADAEKAAAAPELEVHQDGDILNAKGEPFKIRLPAKRAADAAGPGFDVVKVQGGFVARKVSDVSAGAPAATVAAGDGGQLGDNAPGSDPVRGRVSDDAQGGNQGPAGAVLADGQQDAPVGAGKPEPVAPLTASGKAQPTTLGTKIDAKAGPGFTAKDVLPNVKNPAPGPAAKAEAAPVEAATPAGSDAQPVMGNPISAGSAGVEANGVAQNSKPEKYRRNTGEMPEKSRENTEEIPENADEHAARWFGTEHKANGFLKRKGLESTHAAVKEGDKWLIKAKQAAAPVQAPAPAIEKPAESVDHTARAEVRESKTLDEHIGNIDGGYRSHFDYAGTAGRTVWIEKIGGRGWVMKSTDDDSPGITSTKGGVGLNSWDKYAAMKAVEADAKHRFTEWKPLADAPAAPTSNDGALSAPTAKPQASANTVFTADAAAAARAILKKKLGTLNSGIDPELLQAGITLAGYHIEAGARTFAAYAKAMIEDMGEGIKPYLKSFYMAVKFDPRAAGMDGMDSAASVEAVSLESIIGSKPNQETPKSLADSLANEILANNMPKDNPALKKLVEAFDGQPADQNRMKQAQEALEAAIVKVSRDLVAKNEGPRSTFNALLRLYESQPNLNIRTSTSIANQAYSTPAPLAFLGSELAHVTKDTSLYEPTAGNGMLTIGAAPKNVTVNELEPGRIGALKALGLGRVIEGDALKADVAPKSQDRVVTNPPFGSIKDDKGEPTKIKVDGYSLGQIDHLIAARALDAMKDDGQATLIIGANKVKGGLSTDDRIFFNWLYGHYNVTSHFEVSGDLYTRQGAGWPVRVIAIQGRQASARVSPVAGTIQRAENWEQVYEYFKSSLDSSRGSVQAAGQSAGGAGASQAGPSPVSGSAGRPTSAPGGRGQAGSQNGPADVAGASAGSVPDGSGQPGEQLGQGFDEQRLNAESVESNRLDPAGDSDIKAPAEPAGSAGANPLAAGENQFQVTYHPRSARKDGGVLIPVNMAQPTQDALSRLEDAVGDIDQYAAKELGYSSVAQLHEGLMGLQVDSVASAIYQIEQGKGVVIADQTGIGKGRQAAAVIRWAQRKGYVPVFVSVKPSLFTDMFGDLHDIGSDDIVPFIMNKDESIKGANDEKLFANKPTTHKRNLESIRDSGLLPAGTNAIFMTYSPTNTENVQRQALSSLAQNAVFILDESHNAGGASNTGEFITGVLAVAKGVTYLSATYAKRPDNMPLYFKTDIGAAAADNEGLMQAMAAGGLPLQTVVSNNLVQAGQMFRRERSYDGVSIETIADTESRVEHEKLSDETTLALRSIVHADSMFHHVFVKQMNEEAQQAGAAVIDNAGNQAQAGVDHTQFSSVVHNFVKQMLLGLKAQRAADEAIASLKRGEKPIIAVENTMGSFLNAYAADNLITKGGSLGSFDYRTVLSRALARTLFVTEVTPGGDKVKREIKLSELDSETRKAYDDAQKTIDGLNLSIPVSPIDWMRAKIQEAGFTVAEITGRNLAVDYSKPRSPVLSQIDETEQRDKVRTTKLFNSGKLDALILNVAGSTGISLHASEKFEDQRQRHMIVGQAAGDINIFMQMLGRIHRTGQVVLPKYTILSVDLPTEKRPTAVLSGKMKSLNANTSSNTDSATSIKTVDMFNKYGDQVVAQYLQDNYKLAMALGVQDLIGSDDAADDLARKATGRLALQPITVQNAFYDEVEGQYSALMDYLNKTNQNDLEPRTFDYDAKETRQEVLFEGENKDSPFGEDAIYGEYSIKAQGKPMTPAEIREAINTHLDGKTSAQHITQVLEPLTKQFKEYASGLEGPALDSANVARSIGQDFISNHAIGDTFRVDINGETYNAVVTNIRNTHKANGNPFSLSKIQVTVALNGALRSIAIPATQFKKIEVSSIQSHYRIEQLFREQPANQRETAKIITGNLLAAYGEIQGARGTIITFTKEDGTTAQGILLPKAFDFKSNTRGDYRLQSGADALKFLQTSDHRDIGRFGIQSRDGIVRVLPAGQGISVVVPKSKLKGGKFFLDKGLIGALGDFVSSGQSMKAETYDPAQAVKALELLMKKNALYALPSMADEARTITGDVNPDAGTAKLRSAPATSTPGMSAKEVQQIVDGLVGHPGVQNIQVVSSVAAGFAPGKSAKGLTDDQGRNLVFYDKAESRLDVLRTIFHELFHRGVLALFTSNEAYTTAMLDLRDANPEIADAVELWKDTDAGKQAWERAQKNWPVVEDRRLNFEALAVEEVLAEIAEKIKADKQLGSKKISKLVRNLAKLLTAILDQIGFSDLAQHIRNATYSEVEAFVVSTIGKAGDPVKSPFARFMARDEKRLAQTDTPSFKRWFGDSAVVDSKGAPLVVYHGTAATFSQFDADKLGTSTGHSSAKMGAFFSASPDIAAIFAGEKWESWPHRQTFPAGAQTMPVYLSIKNPVEISAKDFMKRFVRGNESASDFSKQAEADGFDGVVIRGDTDLAESMGGDEYAADAWVAFKPTQIKSATGNNGQFDPNNPDIRYRSAAAIGAITQKATDKLNEHFSHPGTLSWWDKSVGSMYHLAERSPAFKRVFDAAQSFINDTSFYATEAANLAPKLLPKLETWKDMTKTPISAADNAAISSAIFGGTLSWRRDESGRPVKVDDLADQYQHLDDAAKAGMLLKKRIVTEDQLQRWLASPLDIYTGAVRNRFEQNFLKAGIVFKDSELKDLFGLTPEQIKLYQEFRQATDASLDNMAKADMLRYGGKDVKGLGSIAMDARDAADAAKLLHDFLQEQADADPERAGVLRDLANGMIERAAKADKLKAEGYAPLSRFGRFSVDVVVDGERKYFSLFESAKAANVMAAKMRQEFGAGNVSQGTLSQREFEMFQGITPESLELFGNMLSLDSTGNEAQDKAFQTYLKLTKNNRSAMKRLIHRKGIAGYSEDAGRVLASFIYSNARQTAAGLHMGDLGDAVNEIPKSQGELKDVAIGLSQYIKQPREEAQALRGMLFAQYLGGSVASAMVNLTQPLMISIPYLSQYGGLKTATAAWTGAVKSMTSGKYEPDLAKALKIAEERGTVSPQTTHQLQAQAAGSASLQGGDGTRAGEAVAIAKNSFTRLAVAWGKGFGYAEQINRRSTFIAAYRIAKENNIADPAAFATKAVDETQFVNNKANKSQWARGPIGATLMTFKGYGLNYLELLHRLSTQGGPEGKKAALLMLAALMLMAGAGGLPFVEDAEDIVDAIAEKMGYNFSTKVARREFLVGLFGKAGAEFVESGVSGLPGSPIDWSSRMGMQNMIPGTGLFLTKRDHTRDVTDLAGPLGDMASRVFQGASLLAAGDLKKAALSIAPKAVGNAYKGFEMADTGMYKDQRGSKVLDVSGVEALMKGIGFQPHSVKDRQEFISQVMRAEDFHSAYLSTAREKWAQGIFEQDQGKVQDAREMISKWNDQNPEQRMSANLPSILRKVREMRKDKDQRIAEHSPKGMRAEIKRRRQEALAE